MSANIDKLRELADSFAEPSRGAPDHLDGELFEIATLLREAAAEIDQLRQQVDWVQAQPDAYEQQMEAITHAARNSYRRTFGARGNTITRADSFDSHLIWAALTYRDSVQADRNGEADDWLRKEDSNE